MKANVFYKHAVMCNVEIISVMKYIISFDVPNDDVTRQYVEFLAKDKNVTMTFYNDCVNITVPRDEVEFVLL